jgi:hypothetical protein
MKHHMTYGAIVAGLLSLPALGQLVLPEEARDHGGQVQEERQPGQEARSSPSKEADAEPEGLSLEEAIMRTLRRQGIDVQINQENDQQAPKSPQPTGQLAA